MCKIEIICIYRSKEGREVEFNSLMDEADIMDYSDLEPKNFLNVMGGVQIAIGNKILFRSTNFYTLNEVVSFLIHSLYWIKEKESGIWNEFDEYPNNSVINTMSLNKEHLILSRKSEKELFISFLPKSNEIDIKRGVYYFKKEIVLVRDWISSVKLALDEYFYYCEKVITLDKSNEYSKILKKYLLIWEKIK